MFYLKDTKTGHCQMLVNINFSVPSKDLKIEHNFFSSNRKSNNSGC